MTVQITAPRPLQVVQRRTVAPGAGTAALVVTGTGAPARADTAELRTVPTSETWGSATPWTAADLHVSRDGGFRMSAEIAAGGWFRVEARLCRDGRTLATAAVEPVGAGELFVVAGQSYATSCHERVTTVADPLGRVTASCPEQPGWRVAHDPQPQIEARVDAATTQELVEMLEGLDLSFPHGPHSPFRGSIWPSAANALQAGLEVPIGFVHVAVGGTRIAHWEPGTQLFENLCDAVRLAGGARAVLWQQGESDARAGTPTQEYRDRLRGLRDGLAAAGGFDLPWVVAKSTHHPTSDVTQAAEQRVRAAVDAVWREPGFLQGPDTDSLRGLGVHRAVFARGGHFTGRGQREAGRLWAEALRPVVLGERAGAGVSRPDARTP